jgi:hypothetical protein
MDNNKHWVEELMDTYESWEDLVKDLIIDRLEQYKDQKIYACDLGYKLFEGENVDGSFTYSTYWSIELIHKYWDDFGDLYENFVNMTGCNLNPFESAEAFVVNMLLEQSNKIIGNLDYIIKHWDNEIILDKKTINKIVKELKNNE